MDESWRFENVWIVVLSLIVSFVGMLMLPDNSLLLKLLCFFSLVGLVVFLVYRVRECSLAEGVLRGKESLPKPPPTQTCQVVLGEDMGFGKVKLVIHTDYNDFTRKLLTQRRGYIPRSIEIVKK